MSNEDKFRQSLKSLVESREFPFEENEWEKAAAYIDKKRFGKRALWIAVIALFVTGVIATYLSVSPFAHEKKTAAVYPAKKETKIEPSESSGSTAMHEQHPTTDQARITGPASSPVTVTKPGGLPAKQDVVKPDTQRQQGQMQVTFTKTGKKQEDQKVPANTSVPAPDNNAGETTPAIQKEITLPAVVNTSPSPEKIEAENPASAETSSAPVASENPTTATAVETAAVPDSIKAKVPRLLLLSAEAGASYMTAWKNSNASRDAQGFNPVFGIHYMNQVDSRFSISFGVQYQRTAHLSAFSHTSKQSHYSFGEESQVTTITPSTLHYLAVPLRLYYKLDEKNTIGGGYSIGYLLDVEAKVQTYTLKVGAESDHKNYTTRGYTDGFALFDSQVSLFYRRHLYGDFSLHSEVFFGLSDVKQNDFFGGNTAQRNSGLRIMLVYGIHSRNK
jgi:hypothetical protein